MTEPTTSTLLGGSAYPTMDRRLENPAAPMIENAWYILAERSEVGEELTQRWILGQPSHRIGDENRSPVVERDPYVWIWTGEVELADATTTPSLRHDHPSVHEHQVDR